MAIRFDRIELSDDGNHLYPYIEGTDGYLAIRTASGLTRIGAGNTGYSHFFTDRSNFYFNASVAHDGNVSAYDGNENLTNWNNVDASAFRSKANTNYLVDPDADSVLHAIGIDDLLFHNGDGDTHLSFGTDEIKFTAGGTERMKITGDVHVQGTTDLNINGTSRRINFTAGNGTIRTTTANNLIFQTNSSTVLELKSNIDAHFSGNVYGKSVNNAYSLLYKFGGLFFTWDSDSYGTNAHHSIRSTYGNTFTDSITLNSFNHIRFNIDSNNNNSTSYFEVGDGGTHTSNVIMRLDNSGHFYAEGRVSGDYFVGTDYATDGYTVYKGYDNWNHFISIRGHARPGQSKAQAAILGGHQTSFVEYAENNDTTGWFFIGSAGTTYEEIAKITKTKTTFTGALEMSDIYFENLYQKGGTTFSENSAGSRIAFEGTNGHMHFHVGGFKKFEIDGQGIFVTGNSKFNGALLPGPGGTNQYNLGTTGNVWAQCHATTFHGDGSNLTGISVSGNFITSDADDITTGEIKFQRNDTQSIIESENTSASNAGQLRIKHSYANVEIRNLRGNLNLFPTSTVNLGYGTSIKLATTSSGVSVTGNVQASNVIGNLATGTNGQQMEYGDTAKTTLRFDADRWRLFAGAGSGEVFTVEQNGEVGIKDSSPSYELDVNGDIRATGDVIAFSDERVKENIVTIDNALDKVTKLRGVQFNKIGEDKKSVGVIAQEVLKVLPEVVAHDDRDMYSVAYGNMVGVLIEAIKELNAEVKDLKEKLNK